MSDTDDNSDQLLLQAWEDFCDRLKAAGRIPFRDKCPAGPLDRAAGFQQLARNISLALAFHYEFRDPRFPELSHYFDPIRKQGGDNSDCVYVGAQVNGTDTYRIHGRRCDAPYFSVTAVERGQTPWGGRVATVLYGHQIETDAEGHFELFVGPRPHPGNWLQTTPDTFRITFRQYFADWEHERPMQAVIDRLGAQDSPAPVLSPQALAQGLRDAADWLHESIPYWPAMLERWMPHRNTFLSYWQLEKNAIDATPGGDPLICWWELNPEEALIIRVRPPQCVYWGVEFGNYWWETVDYRYRLANTNCHYATLEDDGELIVVIAHRDPGVPNWLDCSGFTGGYVTYRWMLAAEHPRPLATRVRFDELAEHLPANVRRMSPAGRREQLATRRRGVIQRFGH